LLESFKVREKPGGRPRKNGVGGDTISQKATARKHGLSKRQEVNAKRVALQAKTVGKAKGGGDKRSNHRGKKSPSGPPTLAEAGIDKDLAKRAPCLRRRPTSRSNRLG
jgi:hypothetical protein